MEEEKEEREGESSENDSMDDNYQMESNQFNFEELKKKENFYIKKYENSTYLGLLVFDEEEERWTRQGNGVMKYLKGRVYEGHWDNDKRNGKGYE